MKSLLPMRFRMLHFLSTVKEASLAEVMEGLKPEYGHEKQFNKADINDHILSMKENGIVEDTRVEFDSHGDLCIYYAINDEGRKLLNKYLPKSWRA